MFRRAPVVAGALALVLLACSSDDKPAALGTATSVTSSPAETTSSSSVPATVPKSPASSPQEAATTFLDAWRDGNQLAALTIAEQAAVDTVFAAGAPGRVQSRGCNSPPPDSPVLCVYRTDVGEVQVRAQPVPDGWIVDQAIVSTD
jgi:hypothetical protein